MRCRVVLNILINDGAGVLKGEKVEIAGEGVDYFRFLLREDDRRISLDFSF